jgi:hypothetical protein
MSQPASIISGGDVCRRFFLTRGFPLVDLPSLSMKKPIRGALAPLRATRPLQIYALTNSDHIGMHETAVSFGIQNNSSSVRALLDIPPIENPLSPLRQCGALF